MTEPELSKEEEQEIAAMFFKELDEARELISAEGGDVGLCPHCMDTNYIFLNKDGYTGIQSRIENEIKLFNECYHGAPTDDGTLPF
jgi:hypothetical protein